MKISLATLGLLLAATMFSCTARAEIVLCAGGQLPGDSDTIDGQPCIDILSFDESLVRPFERRPGDGNGSLGRPEVAPLRFTKAFDRASVPLRRALLNGDTFDRWRLRFFQSAVCDNRESPEYLTIELEEVSVVGLSAAGMTGELPSEVAEAVFNKITYIQRRFNEDCSEISGARVRVTYDLTTGEVETSKRQ